VAVGFIAEEDGTFIVAATTERTAWGLNLLADPRCAVLIGDHEVVARAELLDGADHARAIRELILRYGTPSERLGRGPSFRLHPIVEDP
jgi:hypothetical protein